MAVARWVDYDWRKPEDYAYTEGHGLKDWAWEFLRRNRAYRDLWEAYLDYLTPELHGTTMEALHAAGLPQSLYAQCPAFGLSNAILNPQLEPKSLPWQLRWEWEHGIKVFIGGGRVPESITWREVMVVFDMALPIESQLRAVETVLSERRERLDRANADEEYKIHVPPIRRRPDLWVIWLRVLDAEREGAQTADVARHIFKGQRAPKRRAQKALEKAEEYAESKYKELLMQVGETSS